MASALDKAQALLVNPAPASSDMISYYQAMYGLTWGLGNAMIVEALGQFWVPWLPCPAYGVSATCMRVIAVHMKWKQDLQG